VTASSAGAFSGPRRDPSEGSTRRGAPRPGPTGGAGSRVVWFHCFAGIAGDMALGALLDAGADLAQVLRLLERLPFGGWGLDVETVTRGGLAATRAVVQARDTVVVRTHAHIVGLVEEARLPPRVTRRALATFAALAEVEGRLHQRPPEQVHFHEVGSVDAIVDVVGTAAALEVLDVDEVTASAVATGTGTVRSAHGILPNPSPAVLELLRGIPTWGRATAVELTTPTGAAILAATATGFGPLPALVIESSGYGAGRAELDDLPNCTQAVVGTRVDAAAEPGEPVVLLETTVDDVTGEVLAHVLGALVDAGAHDAWLTPVVMKKGRPGHVVSALVEPVDTARLGLLLQRESGSLGVRSSSLERHVAPRRTDEVEIEGMVVRVKVGPHRAKPEQADAARVAARTGVPLREILARAEAAWRTGPRGAHPAGAGADNSRPDSPDPDGPDPDSPDPDSPHPNGRYAPR
jgi:pyridinium-3,5-bisthiocarboxylic acid mononucleotide nickel chelatase